MKMEKHIIDERTRLEYELVGDYYLLAGDDEPEEQRHIGKWGMLRDEYLRNHRRAIRSGLVISGKLHDHLADIEEQASEMLSQLEKQMAEREGVTEQLKARDQMAWVGAMNSIRNRAEEIVLNEIIFNNDNALSCF